jgi:cold shock CspA family protein
MTFSVGFVKWFGGFNKHQNKENDFGFLTDAEGFDVYLHLKDWYGGKEPNNDDIVVYLREEKGGKWKAQRANFLTHTLPELNQLLEWVELGKSNIEFLKNYFTVISSIKSEDLPRYSGKELALGAQKIGVSKLVAILSLMKGNWNHNLQQMVDLQLVDPFIDIAWSKLPREFSVVENEKEIAEKILSMTSSKSEKLIELNYESLTPSLKMLAGFSGKLTNSDQLNTVESDVESYIRKIYIEKEDVPDFLKKYIDEYIKPKGGVMHDPIFGNLFILSQFKKYLYDKDTKFLSLYESSDYLKSRFDVFVLKEIFSLFLAGNLVDQVYDLFLNRLWEGITSGQLNPIDQLDQILKIFPSCGSYNHNLSCEAVYWKKQEKYLCRGKICHSPKVKGIGGTDYLAFTIYDWFAHYGINYLDDGAPSRRDFPIKIAGYINRLREIFDAIHCRNCQSLMLPNMSYARVEHMVYEKGQLVKKDMAPAYRLTVFKCPTYQCFEAQNEYYINHCYGCNGLIDSRDCKTKCDTGFYICRSCASCCGQHAKTHPVGLCPDCTFPLRLFETNQIQRYGSKYERYVKCSNHACSFIIPTESLDKRFYFDSCGPVERE